MSEIKWLAKPEVHDYSAAEQYLSLLMPATQAKRISEKLRDADVVELKAKDILRASLLPMLAKDNHHLSRNLKKIQNGQSIPPVLLVRGIATADVSLIVADGYHRVCAIESLNEDLPIRCQIVDLN
jgi:hypothetical protein